MSGRSHQGNTDRKNRTSRWNKNYSMAPMADLTGHAPKTCQFISGEDHYMCGKPGFPYCREHYVLTHVKRDSGEAA